MIMFPSANGQCAISPEAVGDRQRNNKLKTIVASSYPAIEGDKLVHASEADGGSRSRDTSQRT